MPAWPARTAALQHALEDVHDRTAMADLLFLEAWELSPTAQVGSVLRVAQIRRANPALADAIRGELARRR
jgi:hypothetical protein